MDQEIIKKTRLWFWNYYSEQFKTESETVLENFGNAPVDLIKSIITEVLEEKIPNFDSDEDSTELMKKMLLFIKNVMEHRIVGQQKTEEMDILEQMIDDALNYEDNDWIEESMRRVLKSMTKQKPGDAKTFKFWWQFHTGVMKHM